MVMPALRKPVSLMIAREMFMEVEHNTKPQERDRQCSLVILISEVMDDLVITVTFTCRSGDAC